jgi:hypothetical protein
VRIHILARSTESVTGYWTAPGLQQPVPDF